MSLIGQWPNHPKASNHHAEWCRRFCSDAPPWLMSDDYSGVDARFGPVPDWTIVSNNLTPVRPHRGPAPPLMWSTPTLPTTAVKVTVHVCPSPFVGQSSSRRGSEQLRLIFLSQELNR